MADETPILQIFVLKHGLQTSIGESIGLKSPDAEKRGHWTGNALLFAANMVSG